MQTEPFTVVLTVRNGNTIEQTTNVIDASCEKEAVRAAFNLVTLDSPNARAAGEIALLGHVVFAGAHTPLNAYNEDRFDFAGQSPGVPDGEKQLFQAIVGGHNAGELAIMSCWLDREPTWALVGVTQEEGSDEINVEPFYLRLTDSLRRRVRSAEGEPLEIHESPETEGDPALH